MKKSFNVEPTFNGMRIDRWIRNNFGNIPQSLIEKSLRSGNFAIFPLISQSAVSIVDKAEIAIWLRPSKSILCQISCQIASTNWGFFPIIWCEKSIKT